MQSYSKGNVSVGYQHSYVEKGTWHSLRTIIGLEGVRGLYRGVDASMLRTGIGSSVQLPSYDIIKAQLLKTGWFDNSVKSGSTYLHFSASAITSFLVCLAMNPFDVSMTRMVRNL
jgi:solute carrier family 25 protein 34/35